uniref:Retrotransposon gag domain-containing protein n=1 Tax=Glypta fumiferanae TaxID=389681 RepID=A0A0F6Y991_9HYME|nr:hypothetical protein [Glypta fumiferanae]
MADEENVYVTKSGRTTKQKFKNYNFTGKKDQNQSTNMPVLPDDRVTEREAARAREIQEERENLNRMRQQLEDERRAFENQRAERQQTVQNIETNQGRPGVSAEEISTIISNVQNFNIDIRMPKFTNESELNPMRFLEGVERFCRVKNVKDDRKLLLIENALEGRASLWFEMQEGIQNYEEFKKRFLEEFYSVPARVKFQSEWVERRYEGKDSLQTYFYSQRKETKYFIPELTDYEINYKIIRQYPAWIKENLATIDKKNTTLIGQTLADLDEIRDERKRDQKSFRENYHPAAPKMKMINAYNPNLPYRFSERDNSRYRRETNYPSQSNYPRFGNRREDQNNQFRMPDIRFPPPVQPYGFPSVDNFDVYENGQDGRKRHLN